MSGSIRLHLPPHVWGHTSDCRSVSSCCICWPSITWLVGGPFIVLWIMSPVVARWASLPPSTRNASPIGKADAETLRLVARRTWRFFETFVSAEDHQLPPDNFQEDPKAVIAHRTSPTNIGLYLLSVVAARDFGWIGTVDTLERLEATLAMINGLEHFHGHLYNWYDTRDLHPLEPKYVSSVDSGNLTAICLRSAMHAARSCR